MMTPDEIFAALAVHEDLPRQAMAAAGERREEMMPIMLDQIDRLIAAEVDTLDARDVASFLYVYFLLGEWRDTRAYRPLTQFLRKSDVLINLLLGDAVTEGTAGVIAGVCDGDIEPICAVIEDPAADEFVRCAMFEALALLAEHQPATRPEIAAYVERFPATGAAIPELLWGTWAFTVADLGLTHLEAQVREAFDAELISPYEATFPQFQDALQKSAARGGAPEAPPPRNRMLIESAIDELESWYGFSDAIREELAGTLSDDDLLAPLWIDTFQREAPKVGRNDPCPCGSGKKYKKCCLQ